MRIVPHSVTEGALLAADAIRSNKLRSALTVLGVVIGVSTVMAMASIVSGIRGQIINTIEVAGPTTFYVVRFFSQTPLNPDNLPREVRIRPVVQAEEARAIAAIPEIEYSGIWIQTFQRMEYGDSRTQLMTVFAADDRYMDIQGGELTAGRFFTESELRGGDPVVVIENTTAASILGRYVDPIGKTVRIGGRPFRVIGVYNTPDNIFQPQSQQIGAIVSFEAGDKYFRYDETNALWIVVKPSQGVTVAEAQDLVRITLRTMRGLRPRDADTFDMITQDQILDVFNQLTFAFFAVMIALSSVALMVGGIGVMAIMLVSVTDRTREIGLRKALGARKKDIQLQFLVEACVLTLAGGIIGIAVGVGAGELLKAQLDLESGLPVVGAAIATFVSVTIGLIFGALPARRAARLDPIEALRHE